LPASDAEANMPPLESGSLHAGAGTPRVAAPSLKAEPDADAVDVLAPEQPAQMAMANAVSTRNEVLLIADRFARAIDQTLADPKNLRLADAERVTEVDALRCELLELQRHRPLLLKHDR